MCWQSLFSFIGDPFLSLLVFGTSPNPCFVLRLCWLLGEKETDGCLKCFKLVLTVGYFVSKLPLGCIMDLGDAIGLCFSSYSMYSISTALLLLFYIENSWLIFGSLFSDGGVCNTWEKFLLSISSLYDLSPSFILNVVSFSLTFFLTFSVLLKYSNIVSSFRLF